MSAAPRQRPVAILVVTCALVVACLAVEFPQLWAERWVQDDAYVSFRYARNLVRGDGLTYNAGEKVEGYSNFLWTVLSVAPLALLPVALQWSFNMWCFSGMETPLMTLLTVAAVGAVAFDPRRHAWAPLALGIASVGLMMTRPDGVVVFAALALTVAAVDGA